MVTLCVGLAIHGLFRLLVPLVGVARIRAFSNAQRAVFFAGVPMLGVAIGWPLGGWLVGQEGFGWFRLGNTNAVVGSLLLALLINFVIYQLFAARARQVLAEKQAAEARLRLLQGQIEPHFLFNTLASLQHWVQTQDPRAATLLEALTGYLRATLPMFSRALQPAADELHAVRLYLQVMQARLGERLTWQEDVDPALLAQTLPPGLLLTLVENAIEHGISPQLSNGRLLLRGHAQGGDAVFEVQDNGPGPALGSRDGIGLANSRERLALSCGPTARLDISARPEGGCLARLQLPRSS